MFRNCHVDEDLLAYTMSVNYVYIIYAVQQNTQSVSMSEIFQHLS